MQDVANMKAVAKAVPFTPMVGTRTMFRIIFTANAIAFEYKKAKY
jgi:hypothetical protein